MLTKREAELLHGIAARSSALVNVFECPPLQRRGMIDRIHAGGYTAWCVTEAGGAALEAYDALDAAEAQESESV